jgi:hypothetical protein
MPTQYDEQVITKFADALYSQARSVEASYAFLGFLLGAGAVLAGALMGHADLGGALPIAAGAGLVTGIAGYLVARPKAFLLRLQAQQALCMAQIERNTRKP